MVLRFLYNFFEESKKIMEMSMQSNLKISAKKRLRRLRAKELWEKCGVVLVCVVLIGLLIGGSWYGWVYFNTSANTQVSESGPGYWENGAFYPLNTTALPPEDIMRTDDGENGGEYSPPPLPSPGIRSK